QSLRATRNTVVVVEHNESFLNASDHVLEIGPAAGPDGGRITFEGPPAALATAEGSVTGPWLSGQRQPAQRANRRDPAAAPRLQLSGCRTNNLQNLTVEFPLGALCVVSGVSGAGKTSLVAGTLAPAVARWLKPSAGSLPKTGAAELSLIGKSASLPEGARL